MFRTARETLRIGLTRFRNRQFLDAAMAAAALVATADGEVTFSEMSALDELLETVRDLQIYDPHVAVDIYRDYADEIRTSPEEGRSNALDSVRRIAGDGDASELLIRVAVAISKADGALSSPEMHTIGALCTALGLPLPGEATAPTSEPRTG